MMSGSLLVNTAGVLRSDTNFNRIHDDGAMADCRRSKMNYDLGTIQII